MRLDLRRAAAALATVVLLGSLAACGSSSSDDGSSAKDDTAPSGSASDGAGGTVLTGLSTGDEVDPGDFVDTIKDGLKSSSTAKTTMKMSMGDTMSMEAHGVLDYTTTPPEMAMTMSMGAGGQDLDYETRLVDGVMYLKMGQISGDKFWKIDPSDPDGPLAEMGMDKMLDQSDPLGMLESVEPAIGKVTYAGSDDVDGRDLDHYELTVDPQAMLKELAPSAGADMKSEIPDDLTYDIWLDDQNRFAQMKMDIPVMNQTTSMTMSVTDWGTDVSIEAPPADQVTDMPDMGSMLGDLGGTGAVAG
jgi:hypothetical protein